MKVTKRVRQDGAINIGAFARRALGITSGMDVTIEVNKGVCTIRPNHYRCALCGNTVSHVVDCTGLCAKCNDEMIKLIKTDKAKTIGDAVTMAKKKYSAKYKAY